MAEAVVVCYETAERAAGGACPVHGGDACLIVLPAFYEEAQTNKRELSELRFRMKGLEK